jgi:hypothetical protein
MKAGEDKQFMDEPEDDEETMTVKPKHKGVSFAPQTASNLTTEL